MLMYGALAHILVDCKVRVLGQYWCTCDALVPKGWPCKLHCDCLVSSFLTVRVHLLHEQHHQGTCASWEVLKKWRTSSLCLTCFTPTPTLTYLYKSNLLLQPTECSMLEIKIYMNIFSLFFTKGSTSNVFCVGHLQACTGLPNFVSCSHWKKSLLIK